MTGLRSVGWRGLFRDTWAYLLGLPGRAADRIGQADVRGHGAVDVSRPSEPMRLWCLRCGEPYPCPTLTALMDKDGAGS